MPTAKVNNINLFYKVTGTGEPLLLVHGHPFDHTMWDPQIDAFSKQYQVIAPDLRGYGKTALPKSDTSRFEDYATDMLALMDSLGIVNFHLAGLSQGGQFIMEIFRQAPKRVKSMILADTFASLDTPEAKQIRYDTADRLEKEGMDFYADDAIFKMILREHVKTMPEVAAYVIKMMKSTLPKGAATALRARAERIDYLNLVLPSVNVPTLVVVGRQDEFTPVAKAEEMQEKLQNCKLVIVEDAGHMPNLEHPDEFNEVVLDFLEGISYSETSL
ncbi:alpha/beta fold hydrolase [Mucilaginibacter flavidus]|uniref:alpha/beta fold hydrolase n=1 Tax=Mucilaginibacter flavidus TaxID=2949309 RepID=UPI0020938E85|nr:alpha/beta hydrolase [Mucilaginibacter flavidus]MCO5946852.1 alpha/beta hydrolase [Mucilaginibacter flavidus]